MKYKQNCVAAIQVLEFGVLWDGPNGSLYLFVEVLTMVAGGAGGGAERQLRRKKHVPVFLWGPAFGDGRPKGRLEGDHELEQKGGMKED